MRITPACAGKTFPGAGCGFRPRDHPRVCGENNPMYGRHHSAKGSPPRVRGKLRDEYQDKYPERITPACAGKTQRVCESVIRSKDHPRVCGENLGGRRLLPGQRGSPPRVRGKRLQSADDLGIARITPACAGKTPRRGRGGQGREDHPRVCGENKDTGRKRFKQSGSPPRVRGKHKWACARLLRDRITPACAGKTASRTMRRTL